MNAKSTGKEKKQMQGGGSREKGAGRKEQGGRRREKENAFKVKGGSS